MITPEFLPPRRQWPDPGWLIEEILDTVFKESQAMVVVRDRVSSGLLVRADGGLTEAGLTSQRVVSLPTAKLIDADVRRISAVTASGQGAVMLPTQDGPWFDLAVRLAVPLSASKHDQRRQR